VSTPGYVRVGDSDLELCLSAVAELGSVEAVVEEYVSDESPAVRDYYRAALQAWTRRAAALPARRRRAGRAPRRAARRTRRSASQVPDDCPPAPRHRRDLP